MFTPKETKSSEKLLDAYGPYLEARLEADPAASGLVGTIGKAQQALRVANDRERAAFRVAQKVQAVRDHAAFALDRQVAEFELALLAHVNKDRASPPYRQYFPNGVKDVLQARFTEEVQKVKVLEAALANAPGGFPLKPFLSKLTEFRGKLEKAIAAREQARVVHAEAQRAEVVERSEWLTMYRTLYAELLRLFPNDRKKAESFFRPNPGSGRRVEEARPAGAPSSEPAAPAA